MRKSWLKLAAVPVALSLVAAACGSDDEPEGGGATITDAQVATAVLTGALIVGDSVRGSLRSRLWLRVCGYRDRVCNRRGSHGRAQPHGRGAAPTDGRSPTD